VNNPRCPYLRASRNYEVDDRIVQHFLRVPNYSEVLKRKQTQDASFLSPIFSRGVSRPLTRFQRQCCVSLAHIPRQGIPNVHGYKVCDKGIQEHVSLTHSASLLTRALVITSVMSDAFTISQVKGLANLHEPTWYTSSSEELIVRFLGMIPFCAPSRGGGTRWLAAVVQHPALAVARRAPI
jgi:hypothetical protein